MKLVNRIVIRISIAFLLLLTTWAFLFYYAMIKEINNETDDALENYSDVLIMRSLAGMDLPNINTGSNNSYFITPVTPEYAKSNPEMEYTDALIYIPELKETEPARTLKTIFIDNRGQHYELTVSTPSIEKENLQHAILYWVVTLYIILFITTIGINILVIRKSMKPLYKLLNWLDHYTIGAKQVSALQNNTNITEFRKLNQAIIASNTRNEALFEQQKQFIGNASHEIQTPLAVCCNRIEWLIDNTNLTEEQMNELLKTRRTLEQITRLNKALLFISKIENGQYPQSHSINMNELIKQQLILYKEIFTSRQITVELTEQNTLQATMNEDLATALISNLLKNAYIHNIPNQTGIIKINITHTTISISNTSPSKQLDKIKIFNRFYQGNKKEGSTGLGLAIVSAICKLYNIDILYSYTSQSPPLHHFFMEWKNN